MRNLYLLTLFISISLTVVSQNTDRYHGRHLNFSQETTEERTTGQSGTGANLDVVYHRANWRIVPDSLKAIRGIVTTYFKTTQNNVSTISFDLNSVFNNASLVVNYHGSTISGPNRTLSSNILTINLPSAIATSGTLDSITIAYYGVPPAVSGAAQGYQRNTSNAATPYISTLSESYEDRDWWPCKADMQDKIDSMDIIVSTKWSGADTFWVATNGVLVDSTISGSNRTFTFKTRYPITSYLVAVSVAKYNRYYRGTANIGGIQVPVVYYLFRGKTAATYNNILTKMDQMTTLMVELSNKFGYYPFRLEKHGYYEGLDGAGGMEHQTFSAMATSALTSSTTLAHELMHQWFGDKVTFATWAHLWLAEGFARYGEVLAGELVPATGVSATSELSAARTAARNNTSTPARITSYATSNQVWTGSNVSAVYDRGCMIVSMLRLLVGDDMFFQACRNYLDENTGSGYGSATSDTLKNHFERLSGQDLDPFFNTYVYDNGHPTYTIYWQPNAAGGIYLSVGSQTVTGTGAAPYFNGPVAVRVQASGQDTTIVFYDLTNGNHTSGSLAKAGNGIEDPKPGNRLYFPLSFVPTTVSFLSDKVLGGGSMVQVSTLDLEILSFDVAKEASGNKARLTLDGNENNVEVKLQHSTDGISFLTIGDMLQVSSTSNNMNYEFTHTEPVNGNNYYRSAFTNMEGETLYSRIVNVVSSVGNAVQLANNPVVSGKAELIFNSAVAEPMAFFIYDGNGRTVLNGKLNAGSRQSLDVRALSKGVYMLNIPAMKAAIKMIVH